MAVNRRQWGRWCASSVLAAFPGAGFAVGPGYAPVSPAADADARRLDIAVVDKSAFCVLPLTVAERLRFFPAEGLEVQIRDYPDTDSAVQAWLQGRAQVLSASFGTAVLMQARGVAPMTSFLLQGRTPQLVLGLSTKAYPDARPLKSLRSLRVGVAGMHTGAHRVARVVLAKAGLAPTQVRYVPLRQHSEAIKAFRTGAIDAICHTDPTMTLLEQEGGLKVLADTRTVQGNAEVFGGPLPAACLAASATTMEARPEVFQAMSHAMVRALKWLQTAGPSDIIRVVPESYFMGDRALYLSAFSRAREAWTPDGVMPREGPDTLLKVVSGLGEMQELKGIDLARTYTNQFALKAKARYRA
ncbi:MAG: ABC transporter substrate-binding protein [Gammaproteobacteria bacterium]